MSDFKLPDVGEGLTEAEIVTWKVQVGDVVRINDVVVEIETAKSLVELPSPYAGTVQALHVPEGETVAVGTPIISIGDAAEVSEQLAGVDLHDHLPEGSAPPAAPPAAGQATEAARAPAVAAAEVIDLSNPAATGGGENQTLVGYGPRVAAAQRRARRGGARGAAAPEAPSESPTPAAAPAAPARVAAPEASTAAATHADLRVLAKPPVRKLAKDLGVDLRTLVPSGPEGTVSRSDVEAASRTGLPDDRERREPVKGVRKMMARAMVASAFTAPHVTEWVTVDVTATMRLVERLRAHPELREVRVSPLLVVARAVCLALARTPEVNATWDDAAQEVVFRSYVNLGIAAATPRGLVVPNVKDAHAQSLPALGRALNQLTSTAREGRTQPTEMSGGTFTITNVGVFGVDAGTPIINPGESGILCFGAVRKQPWVVSKNGRDKIKVRDVTTLALSFDHRLVDGEKGSRFLADVAAVLHDPGLALLL